MNTILEASWVHGCYRCGRMVPPRYVSLGLASICFSFASSQDFSFGGSKGLSERSYH